MSNDFVEHSPKLLDLVFNHLESHCIADAVPQNNDLVGIVSVHVPELLKCISVNSIEILLDNLLSFCLTNDVLVEARASRVC
jgi:hypothetical protein